MVYSVANNKLSNLIMLAILPNYLINTLFRFAPTEPYSLIPKRTPSNSEPEQGKKINHCLPPIVLL